MHDSQYLLPWPVNPHSGLEKVLISPWLVTPLHICGVIPTPQSAISPETPPRYRRQLCPGIAGNSARSPTSPHHNSSRSPTLLPQTQTSPHRAPTSPHRAPISSHWMTSVRVFHDVSQCFKSVSWRFTSGSQCFTMYHNVSHVFYDILLCLTMLYV